MTTALGNRSKTGTLLAEQIGTLNDKVNTLYVDNIIPHPSTVTPNLQNICVVGNQTTTDVIITGGGDFRAEDPASDCIIGQDVTAGRNMIASNDVTAGNNIIADGEVVSAGKVTAGTGIVSTTGDIVATAGNMVAGTDLNVGNQLTVTSTSNLNGRLNVVGRATFNSLERTTTIIGKASSPETLTNLNGVPSTRKTFSLGANHSMTLYCVPDVTTNQTFVFEVDTPYTHVLRDYDIRVSFQTASLGGGPKSLGFGNVAIGPSVKTPTNQSALTILVNSLFPYTGVEVAKINVLFDYDPSPP